MTAEAPPETPEVPWRRLSWRMLAVNAKWLVPPVLSVAVYAVFTGGNLGKEAFTRLGILTGIFVLVLLGETVDVLTTRFRVTGERFELRRGVLARRHKSIPLDRVRRVDVTANPLHRMLGLVVLRVGTGQRQDGEELKLAALRKDEAERLRAGLVTGSGEPRRGAGVLAELRWSWLRYSPLTVTGVLGIAILAGAGIRALEVFGIRPNDVFAWVRGLFGELELWKVLAVLAAGLIVLGVLGCLVAFADEWWGYRFERAEDGAFHVRRGLLTKRNLSLDESRVRGVELVETMLMRSAGAARVDLISSGMDAEPGEGPRLKSVTPAVPAAEANRIVAEIVGESPPPTAEAWLEPHPKAALRRRRLRAVLVVLVPAAVLALVGALVQPVLVAVAAVAAVALVPVALLLAADAYRALGHRVRGRYLVVRAGTADRRTVALRRDGVLAMTIRRSPTQRLSGLATVVVATSAGKGAAYLIRDAGFDGALAVADETVPGLWSPFVRRG
ncbi:PH domain-containing protein [Amycolatopsis minnesotensis]|uniref:YdbS-like PH domain-containing protein n=1 Tax=Amycolatopsis minnesotensis TaxID=337894 RepID=A0ABP5DIE8_9PSEU